MIALQVFHSMEQSDSPELVSIIIVLIVLWVMCNGNLGNIFGHGMYNKD